jgi:hypothetical protein
MAMKRKIPFLVLLLLVLIQLACQTESRTRRQVKATFTAIAELTRTAEAFEALPTAGSTVQPSPTKDCKIWDVLCLNPIAPELTSTPASTPTPPAFIGTVKLKNYRVDYFEEPGDTRELGTFAKDMVLPVVEVIHNGHFLRVQLSGDMELRDLGFKNEEDIPETVQGLTGETDCDDHKWHHNSRRSLCHAHFWLENGDVVVIPKGLPYIIVSKTVSDGKVEVVIGYVWIRGEDVR